MKRQEVMEMDSVLEREIKQLINARPIKPKFQPLPDISDILLKDVSKHPLMTFNANALKKHQVDSYL